MCLITVYRLRIRTSRRRLLTDRDARLRERLIQVLFKQGKFQWERLENLVELAQEGAGELDLTDTVSDGAQVSLF